MKKIVTQPSPSLETWHREGKLPSSTAIIEAASAPTFFIREIQGNSL